jgi:hypothetical protein
LSVSRFFQCRFSPQRSLHIEPSLHGEYHNSIRVLYISRGSFSYCNCRSLSSKLKATVLKTFQLLLRPKNMTSLYVVHPPGSLCSVAGWFYIHISILINSTVTSRRSMRSPLPTLENDIAVGVFKILFISASVYEPPGCGC